MQRFFQRKEELIFEFDSQNRLLYTNKAIPETWGDLFQIDIDFQALKLEQGFPTLEEVVQDL